MNPFSNFWWWWSSATLLLASWWWWWSGLWTLDSGPELANCSQARRPLIMSHMCVWLAGLLGWLADWLAFFVLFFFFFFFFSSSSVCNQSLSPQKTQIPQKFSTNFAPFSSKKKILHGEERKRLLRWCCWWGGPVQARNYDKTFVRRQTNKQTAMAPASGRGRSDLRSQSGDDPTIKI